MSQPLKTISPFPHFSKILSTQIQTPFTLKNKILIKKSLKPNKIHPFDKVCNNSNTEHRLTKFAHPWTNGQVKKMNHIIKVATLELFHYETIDEYSQHLVKFLNYYNFEKKLKSLRFTFPYDIILKKYQDNPSYYCVGLNK